MGFFSAVKKFFTGASSEPKNAEPVEEKKAELAAEPAVQETVGKADAALLYKEV